MKLGWSEWWLMNNPIRALAQRWFEAPRLLHMGGRRPGARALEIGCGNGGGTELLIRRFGVRRVDAFDLDRRMVRLAAARPQPYPQRVRYWVGNTRHIPIGDRTYDAVFDFGALHHVRHWPSAVTEIHRVLKPGGRFYAEEITRQFIVHPIWKRLLDHPQENRFDRSELVNALEAAGFNVRKSRQWARLFIWCVADRR